ncbi:extracellular solute-binding protein [Nocardia sp. NPDC050799]|uniref:ABC transporter substrate-binding protein n=1 Tax=Nocardia sp. NPDC050799 TaxID=3154842 RepID=UPI00340C3D45
MARPRNSADTIHAGRNRRAGALAASLTLALGLVACGGSANPTGGPVEKLAADDAVVAELDTLYQAARQDGRTEVTVYLGGAPLDDVWKTFSRRYPEITVEPVGLYGAEFVSKIEQEHSSGRVLADVVLQGPSSVLQQAEQGYFADFDPAGAAEGFADVARDKDLDGTCIAPYGEAAALTYNTGKVSKEDAPASWDDLVDEKWKGRLVLPQLDKPGTTSRTFGVLAQTGEIDDGWLDRLAGNEPVGVAESTMTGAAVVSGKGDVGLGRQATLVREIEKGAPLGVVYPMESASVISTYFGCVMDKAPNSNAGKLLLSWLFTEEAQNALAGAGYYPLREGVRPLAPFPPIEEVGNVAIVSAKDEPKLIASMTKKMVERFK